MKIRPLHDRILVERVEEKEQVRGGIIIPDTAKEKPQEGKVVAAGNGKVTEDGKKIPLDVKSGDRILFGKYSGSEVKIDEKEYLILREEDVLAILAGWLPIVTMFPPFPTQTALAFMPDEATANNARASAHSRWQSVRRQYSSDGERVHWRCCRSGFQIRWHFMHSSRTRRNCRSFISLSQTHARSGRPIIIGMDGKGLTML